MSFMALMSSFEFEEIFGAVGKDAGSSKTSTKKWLLAKEVKTVFGDLFEDVKAKTSNKPGRMERQVSTGKQPVSVNDCTLTYSKTTNNCKFKFEVSTEAVGEY